MCSRDEQCHSQVNKERPPQGLLESMVVSDDLSVRFRNLGHALEHCTLPFADRSRQDPFHNGP